ncbi:rod-binding protein [Roseibium sp.]|uniref:rod-binding protein n=1 Tax=Roseibium sp. TaxID=1936156 RepID=UPI003A970CB7
MAIAPPSDLVLDVVRAADPVERSVAAGKLQRLAAVGYADGSGFRSAIDDTMSSSFRANGSAGATGSKSPAEKFEALVLHQFVETMLPDDAGDVFGKGATGEIWKSMLAEQVANQMAASGGIGIADLMQDTLKRGTEA